MSLRSAFDDIEMLNCSIKEKKYLRRRAVERSVAPTQDEGGSSGNESRTSNAAMIYEDLLDISESLSGKRRVANQQAKLSRYGQPGKDLSKLVKRTASTRHGQAHPRVCDADIVCKVRRFLSDVVHGCDDPLAGQDVGDSDESDENSDGTEVFVFIAPSGKGKDRPRLPQCRPFSIVTKSVAAKRSPRRATMVPRANRTPSGSGSNLN